MSGQTATTTPARDADLAVLSPALSGARPAEIGRRVVASLLDAGVVVGGYLLGGLLSLAEPVAGAVVGLLWVLAAGTYQWHSHATTGQTIGKRAMGLRTVTVGDGGLPGWSVTAGRYALLGAAGGLTCGLGGAAVLLSILWDRDGASRGWHDKIMNAVLIDLRRGRDTAPAAASEETAPSPVPAPSAEAALPPAPPPPAEGALPPPPPAPGPASPPVPPVPAAGSSAASGPAPLISGVPGLSRPSDPPPVAAPVPAPQPAPVVAAGTDPAVDDDDVEATRMSVRRGPVLVLDSGERVPVRGRGLLGRNPAADAGETVEHLVDLLDPTMSVSKTHLEFGVDDGGVWVTDRHSTNGTAVVVDGHRTEVEPGRRVPVPHGATVELGDRRFTVEAG